PRKAIYLISLFKFDFRTCGVKCAERGMESRRKKEICHAACSNGVCPDDPRLCGGVCHHTLAKRLRPDWFNVPGADSVHGGICQNSGDDDRGARCPPCKRARREASLHFRSSTKQSDRRCSQLLNGRGCTDVCGSTSSPRRGATRVSGACTRGL